METILYILIGCLAGALILFISTLIVATNTINKIHNEQEDNE